MHERHGILDCIETVLSYIETATFTSLPGICVIFGIFFGTENCAYHFLRILRISMNFWIDFSNSKANSIKR